jgi:cytochrome c-type biogenesis protein CcmE
MTPGVRVDTIASVDSSHTLAVDRGGRVPKNRAWLNPKIAIAAVVLACAVGYLMYTSVQSTSASYFVTVSELIERADEVDGQRVRVGGDVVEGSVTQERFDGEIYFEITDGTESIGVVFEGVTPDIFGDHTEAVVEGVFHKDGVFEAETVLTKCPSRFDAEDDYPDDEYHNVLDD